MGKLTVSQIRSLKTPGRYGDGGGLYLLVSKSGSRSWVQRIMVAGRRLDKGLGGYPSVSLSEARKIADANRVEVSEGRNPWALNATAAVAEPKNTATVPTFREAAYKIHQDKIMAGEIASEKHQRNWIQTLERHAFPILGDTPIDEISQRDVKLFLEDLGPNLTETARRVRSRMREIFDDAIEAEYITVNPAGDGIRGSVKRWSRAHTVEHFTALPYQDVPAALEKIRRGQQWTEVIQTRRGPFQYTRLPRAMRETRLAFEFLVFTAARSGEVRGATWDEIDLDNDVWEIPPERMKASRPHRTPLSFQAKGVLEKARQAVAKRRKRRPDYGPSGLVFPHPSGSPLSDNALSSRAKKDALGCVPHGFRSSFRDWAAECSGASWEAIELSLAHKVGTPVERAYFRSDLLEQRRPLMQAWADFIDPLPF